ncbi:hypothetical protein Tco_0628106 [Tanacetum coccineum]|uniref:Uncharacterized protein n=1 Tax=Tanacetum coccineum TaxID=301880 RepID=A0ABQ4WPC5_9ASTR
MMVQDQEEVGEGLEMPTDPHYTPIIIQPSTSQPQKKQRSRRSKRKDTKIPQSSGPTDNVADEAVNEEMDDSLERAATTATVLEAEQENGNIDKTQSKATLNEPSSPGTSSGSGSRCQETMGDTIAQTRSKNVSKLSNDPLLGRGNTLRSGEDRLKLEELMALCTTLQLRVLALETTKTTQATEIASLKKRVKKLECLGEEDASKQGRIADVDANEDIYFVNVNDLDGDEVIVESVYVVKIAEETRKLKSAKPKATTPTLTTTTPATTITAVSTRPRAKGIFIHKQEQAPTPTVSSQQPSQVKVQDKGTGKMVKPEHVKQMSKKQLLMLDEELAFKLQAEEEEEEEEEERLAREKAQQVEEANIAWDDVQAKIDADYQLSQRMQAQEQDELTDEEKARLSIMCTYLKNMEGWKPKSLKNKFFANIQDVFDKEMKRVNTFVDYRTELVEESSKKEEAEIANESSL